MKFTVYITRETMLLRIRKVFETILVLPYVSKRNFRGRNFRVSPVSATYSSNLIKRKRLFKTRG